jgi:hypothetical protein
MPYHSNFERCHMVEALQVQARFCDELACACLTKRTPRISGAKRIGIGPPPFSYRPTNRSRQSAGGHGQIKSAPNTLMASTSSLSSVRALWSARTPARLSTSCVA